VNIFNELYIEERITFMEGNSTRNTLRISIESGRDLKPNGCDAEIIFKTLRFSCEFLR